MCSWTHVLLVVCGGSGIVAIAEVRAGWTPALDMTRCPVTLFTLVREVLVCQFKDVLFGMSEEESSDIGGSLRELGCECTNAHLLASFLLLGGFPCLVFECLSCNRCRLIRYRPHSIPSYRVRVQ